MTKKALNTQFQTAFSEEHLEACIEAKMSEGLSQEDAERECKAIEEENREYAEEEPKFPASDSHLGIVGREATPLEKCMSLRIDLFNEDEVTARRTCTKMFNTPLVKNKTGLAIFEEYDPDTIGLAFHKWDLKYSPDWAWYRRKQATEKSNKEKAITKIIKELKSDANSEDRFLSDSDSTLREKAERIYNIRKGKTLAEMQQRERESRLTVGSLFGKNKSQIIHEQHKPQDSRLTAGDQFGRTRQEIVEELREEERQEEQLKKLRRRDILDE